MRTLLLTIWAIALSTVAAQAAESAIPLDPTGRAPGSPTATGEPPPLSSYNLGLNRPRSGTTGIAAPAYASDNIGLASGTDGALMYDPNGSLPTAVNPDATMRSSSPASPAGTD